TTSNTLAPTTSTYVTSQGLYDGTHAANYTQDNSTLSFYDSVSRTALIDQSQGMVNLWLYTGQDWRGGINPSHAQFLLAEGGAHYGANSFTLFRDIDAYDGALYFRRWGSGGPGQTVVGIPATWKAGEWHNIGISWQLNGQQAIYLDGAFINSVACYEVMNWTTTEEKTLYVGKNASEQNWAVDGMIYGFTVYNDADNVAAVMAAAAANTPSPIPEPAALGLLALGAALAAPRRRR
ncbi:MAG: hypothetical protein WC708_14235, partial [Lentisphaeria bacterium]